MYIKSSLLTLACDASSAAIKQWGGSAADITHIVFCSSTGSITMPALDTVLCRRLGLRGDIKRLNVENMGCLGGFKCLALANEFAIAKPDNIVLVVVCDIRSALVCAWAKWMEATCRLDRPVTTAGLTCVTDVGTSSPGTQGNQLTPHVDYTPVDRANVIASCLFRDSGGACIVAHPAAAAKAAPPLMLPGEEGPL